MVSLWAVIKSKLQRKPFSASITLAELKSKWAANHYISLTDKGIAGYEHAWSKISPEMRNKAFLDLKWADWQAVINLLRQSNYSYYTQKRIKNLCGQLYKFAILHELCERNFAPMLELSRNIPKEKVIYTDAEIKTLLAHREEENVKMILTLIFTGVRISELLRIKPSEDVFMSEGYFIVRRSKTIAGTNRPIPIHAVLKPIFSYFIAKKTEYLISINGHQMSYTTFRGRYITTLEKYDMKHTIHECRHTLASLLDDANANEMCIRRILGHAAHGVTKKVYTHKNLTQLFAAMALLEQQYQ